jgi:hypothetical protein
VIGEDGADLTVSREVIAVDFKPRPAGAPDLAPGLRVTDRWRSTCQHGHISVDEDLRIATCSDCGERLDPVWVLLQWARHWSRLADSCRYLGDEIERRTKVLEDLKREERNCRARIRRAPL